MGIGRCERLLAAYRRGIFPWYSAGQPVLWWSPNPREVLEPGEFKCSRSLAKTLRNRGFEVAFDRDFPAVVSGSKIPQKDIRHMAAQNGHSRLAVRTSHRSAGASQL